MEFDINQVFTPRRAAKVAGVSPSAIYTAIKSGVLKATKWGGTILIAKADLLEYHQVRQIRQVGRKENAQARREKRRDYVEVT